MRSIGAAAGMGAGALFPRRWMTSVSAAGGPPKGSAAAPPRDANRASAGLARFASRGGAAADPFGAPPAADTEVIQRRGNNAPAPVPAAAPMDRKGR